ncbi:MAG: DNA/RNA nuclease SfsA [Ruminococcaceae bacterium]|nr:DNA/RNA nuclease SfsA [Oscillospiraceae bacterium]
MKYARIQKATFLSRPNRFIAIVEIDGCEQVCHVKNTGRCRELLVPGATVFVQAADNPDRKTKFDLIAVYKGDRLVNMDSQVPNKVFYEWIKAGNLFSDVTLIKPETTYKNSRFDFYIEAGNKKIFVEVKGVTLEKDDAVYFPDAPTERGVKHLNELVACRQDGFEAYVVFVVQMKGVTRFSPHDETHKAFGDALRAAAKAGVNILAVDCRVTPDTIEMADFVPIVL